MVQWILGKYPFDHSGEILKGIVKVLFILNFFLIWAAYIVGSLITLFVDVEIFLWVVSCGLVGCLVEIAAMYFALLSVYAMAELSANSCVLVERDQAPEETEEEECAAPVDNRPPIPEGRIPAWKRVEMERAGIPVPADPQPEQTKPASLPNSQASFDQQKIPTWKRIQMEQEAKQDQ